MVLNVPGLSEHQRNTLQDIDKALKFFLDHERQVEGVTMKMVLDKAGIESYANFDYVIKTAGGKNIPEVTEALNSLRERLKTLGVEPAVFKYVRRPRNPNSAPQDLKLETSLPPSQEIPAQKVTSMNKLAEQAEKCPDELTAWNICAKALTALQQRQRENVLSSVASFFGLGVV